MSRTGTRWTMTEVAYAEYPPASPLLRRLGAGRPPDGFPLFDAAQIDPPDDRSTCHRAALTETLTTLNATWADPLDASTASAIRGDGVFVIGGQQPVLAGGPMMCLLKIATAIGLAQRLAGTMDRPVIPAFWIAGEDHDIEEVNRLSVGGRWVVCEHDELAGGGPRPPVASLSPAPVRRTLVDALDRRLPAGEAKQVVQAALAGADWSSYPALFATVMSRLLPPGRSVVWIEPTRMRKLAVAAMQRIARDLPAVLEAFEAGQNMLRRAGFDPPLERVNLFEMVAGRRRVCPLSESGAMLHDGPVGGEQLAGLMQDQPQRFSPGAALRPIVQDMMLPVAVTVAGPTELLYLWQIDPMYRALGVRRSKLVPRLSATLLDASDLQLAGRYDLTDGDLFEVGRLLDEYDPMRYPVEDGDLLELERLRNELIGRMEEVGETAPAKMIDKACQSVGHQVDKLIWRVREERLSRGGLGKGRLAQLAGRLMPGGAPAERTMAAVEAAGRWGVEWLEALIEQYDPGRCLHHVMVADEHEPGQHEQGA